MTASAPTVGTEIKGLRFVSGARMRSVTYVVRPAVPVRDPLTGRQTGLAPALRAVFKEHQFNSQVAQQANRWTNEERKLVEKHLIMHPDFGRTDGRGIHLDNSTTLPQRVPDYLLDAEISDEEHREALSTALAPIPGAPRCDWVGEEPDASGGVTVVQCSENAAGESGYCVKHEAMIEAATEPSE